MSGEEDMEYKKLQALNMNRYLCSLRFEFTSYCVQSLMNEHLYRILLLIIHNWFELLPASSIYDEQHTLKEPLIKF